MSLRVHVSYSALPVCRVAEPVTFELHKGKFFPRALVPYRLCAAFSLDSLEATTCNLLEELDHSPGPMLLY